MDKKKSKMKSSKRKVLAHRFRTKSSSSLSELLHIGAYKAKISNLRTNNRHLARELQKARSDIADNSTLLDACAEAFNQIMFARGKITDMTHTVSKLVNDMDELTKYLDKINNNKVKFLGNGFGHLKKKVPTVESIEELSVISSDHSIEENMPASPITSQNVPCSLSSRKKRKSHSSVLPGKSPRPSTSGKRGSISSMQAVITDSSALQQSTRKSRRILNIIESNAAKSKENSIEVPLSVDEMPPILFVEEFVGNSDDKSSKNKSSEHQKKDTLSLTPELDIDLSCFQLKRSSGRRQTRFRFSTSKQRKSKEKASPESVNSSLKHYEECPVESDKKNKVFKISESCRKDNDINKSDYLLHHPESILVSAYPIVSENASGLAANVPLHVVPDNTLLLNEDMELTENISAPIFIANTSTEVANDRCVSEIKSATTKAGSYSKERCIPVEHQHFAETDNPLPDGPEATNKQTAFREQNENFPCSEVASFDESFSSNCGKQITRRKNFVKCAPIFLESSEDEYTPIKAKSTKNRSTSSIKRETVIFRPKKNQEAAKIPIDCLRISSAAKENSSFEASIFDLNASQSGGNSLLKKSKLSRNKSVTKKKEIPTKSNQYNDNVTSSSSSINKDHASFLRDDNLEEEVFFCMKRKESSQNYKSVLKDSENSPAPHTPKKIAINTGTPRSESKKVSFAATDLVCNFKKMSLCKTIAANRKVKRTSKSASEIENLTKSDTDYEVTVTELDISLEKQKNEADSLPEFDDDTEMYSFSMASNNICNPPKEIQGFDFDDETEIYALSVPSHVGPVPKEAHIIPSKITTLSITEEKVDKICRSKGNLSDNVSNIRNSNKNRSKMSLKGVVSAPKNSLAKETSVESFSSIKSIVSPNVKSKKSKIKLFKDCKENLIQTTPPATKVSKKITSASLAPIKSSGKNQKIDIGDLGQTRKASRAEAKKVTRKESKAQLCESSPVLKDKMNLETPLNKRVYSTGIISEGNCIKEPSRRRRKTVNYGEPPLNKKMRRD